MKHLKIISVLLSVAICMSFVMTPVLVTADETEAPEQTIEATEAPETSKETEAAKETEKPDETGKETEPAETEPAEETVPETSKVTEPSEETVPEETKETETEPSEQTEPSAAEEPSEPAEPSETTPEPETASRKRSDVQAGGGPCGDNASWKYDGYGNFTVTGTGKMQDFVNGPTWQQYLQSIKTVVISEGITKVGSDSFYGAKNIETVKLPDTLHIIGTSAFQGCTSLSDITLPFNLTDIQIDAFKGCTNLKSIAIPGTATRLSMRAFDGCGLTCVTINNGVQILDDVFPNCTSLTTISIPKSVTSMENAFTGCTGIKEIYYEGTADDWSKINGLSTNLFKNATIHYAASYHSLSVKPAEHGSITLSKYTAIEDEPIKIIAKPDEGYYLSGFLLNGNKWIGTGFSMLHIDVVVQPVFDKIVQANIGDIEIGTEDPFVYEITDNAMDGTGTVKCDGFVGIISTEEQLKKLYAVAAIPSTVMLNGVVYKVTVIDSNAFRGNKYLKTVTIGSNVTVIGNNAFYGCPNLTKVSGGARLKTIGANAFARCPKLSSFTITSKVLNKIGTYAFAKDSRLKTINIKNTTKLSKKSVKKSLKSSKIKTVKVKKSKVGKYRKYFTKKNCGRKVTVKK